MWRQNAASLAHVASGSQVASPDVASKRGVLCRRGVREPGGVTTCGDKTSVTCPRDVRDPGGVARCGVKTWRHCPTGPCSRRQIRRQNVASRAHVSQWPHLALQDVAPERGVARSRGVREPRGVAGCGVKTWRAGAIDLRGVAGRGVTTWRQEAQASRQVSVLKTCLQSSGDMCAPTGDRPVKGLMKGELKVVVWGWVVGNL